MPAIDPRLLPLIETLSASGADWLAFEILDGIRAGRPAEDSEEELRDARRAVSAFRQKGERLSEREAGHDFVDPITGDDQIDFAARYAFDRLSDAIQMLNSSFAHLDLVVARKPGATLQEDAIHEDRTGISVRIEGSDMTAIRREAREALEKLAELRDALAEWADRARAGEDTP